VTQPGRVDRRLKGINETATSVDEFDDFARATRSRLVGLAYSLTGDRSIAEDIAQDALLATHQAWADLSSPLAYARRTAVNLAATRVRHAGRERRAFARWSARAQMFTELAPVDAEFWRTVAALPPRQREVVALHYVEDLAVADIAIALEIAPGSVKSALHDARRALAHTLGLEHEEDR
jgi:RNA polymerase sigma-70 factor (ECF subfamily)